MEAKVIFVAGLLYLVCGMCHLADGNKAWALVWLAYAAANFGLMVAQGGGQK